MKTGFILVVIRIWPNASVLLAHDVNLKMLALIFFVNMIHFITQCLSVNMTYISMGTIYGMTLDLTFYWENGSLIL